ncbi:MAG: HPr family phosphocarrier protein [Holophagales bacterium]|nr:HPr family phosphocarrier protein [Holophagales bacterium]
MVERELEIVNRLGLHARAAAKLVHTAARFSSEITIHKDGDRVDAKSILGLLQLGAARGTSIVVSCEGDDEADAMESMVDLIEGRFGEES